jgi:hypothetical protein
MHSHPAAHCLARGQVADFFFLPFRDGFRSWLRRTSAGSPVHQAESSSALSCLWTGHSLPVAPHPVSRRRSYLQLRTGQCCCPMRTSTSLSARTFRRTDVAPPELIPVFCVSCYKDLAPTEPLFNNLLGAPSLRYGAPSSNGIASPQNLPRRGPCGVGALALG